MHIDEWLNSKESLKLSFVKEWFTRFRKPEFYKIKDGDNLWFENNWLFCIYQNKRYQVTGCSRFGDIWITSNFDQSIGYENQVDFSDCSGWAMICINTEV